MPDVPPLLYDRVICPLLFYILGEDKAHTLVYIYVQYYIKEKDMFTSDSITKLSIANKKLYSSRKCRQLPDSAAFVENSGNCPTHYKQYKENLRH